MLTPPELVWLLAAVAKGDEAAFARLYAATRAKLYGVVLRILRREDLADQVMQDVYLRIWRDAGQFDPLRSAPVGWLVAIARKQALDLQRGRPEAAVDAEPAPEQRATDTVDPFATAPMSDDLRRLLACIGRLPPERQRLVLLAYYDGASRDELAAQLGQPVTTIETGLRRSLLEIGECPE